MRVRFASLALSWLLVALAIFPPLSAAVRVDHQLGVAHAGSERLYLPSATPLTRSIAVSARGEAPLRIERRRIDAAGASAFADRVRRFGPEAPASHDKRPLPRAALDEPPQPDEPRSLLA